MIYPNGCNNEAQKLEYLYDYKARFIEDITARGKGHDSIADEVNAILTPELERVSKLAQMVNFHEMTPTHVQDKVIFPDSVKKSAPINVGSRLSALWAVEALVEDREKHELVHQEICEMGIQAGKDKHWEASLSGI